MSYTSEFRLHWPALVGGCFGMGLGTAFHHYMSSLFAPALIGEFGWSRADFALATSLSLVSLFIVPIAGRFVDRFGPPIAAAVGFVAMPLSFVGLAVMTGDIYEYYAITMFQFIFGVLTSSMVFGRVIVGRFDLARGIGLSIVMSGAPLVGAVAAPLIGNIIETEGWRVGYLTMAAMSVAGGIIAIFLITRRPAGETMVARPVHSPAKRMTRKEFAAIVRKPAFGLLVAGMFLINIPQVFASSQIALVLLENGTTESFAAVAVSLYALGVIAGRFATGLALDRFTGPYVAACVLGLPVIGFLLLASPLDAAWLLAAAVGLVGIAQGAEGDVGAYLTSRNFSIAHYGFIYSFVMAGMGVAISLGSVILSICLRYAETFDLFLVVAGIVTALGAFCFVAMAWVGTAEPGQAEGDGPQAAGAL